MEPGNFKGIIVLCQILVRYTQAQVDENQLPRYLQDMMDTYAANQAKKNASSEETITMDPREYLYQPMDEVASTTHYLDRYSMASPNTWDMNEINFFTNFPDDDELVYTGPSMDPQDLLGLDLGNTEGWKHFELDKKQGPLQCAVCKKKFLKEEKYFDHLLTVENMTTPHWFIPMGTHPERYKKKAVTCPDQMCTEKLKNFGLLRIHLLEVHNGLPHNWNVTSDEYVRDSIQRELTEEMKAHLSSLAAARPRRYSRRTNVTRQRRTRTTTTCNGTTRAKRKYVRRSNTSRLPRTKSFGNISFTIYDDEYRKNTTDWLNEYPG